MVGCESYLAYTIHVRTRCTPEKCFCLSALSLQSSACLSVFSDDVFSGQDVLFQCLGESLLDNAFMGYNACIFAYGQTGKISKHHNQAPLVILLFINIVIRTVYSRFYCSSVFNTRLYKASVEC